MRFNNNKLRKENRVNSEEMTIKTLVVTNMIKMGAPWGRQRTPGKRRRTRVGAFPESARRVISGRIPERAR